MTFVTNERVPLLALESAYGIRLSRAGELLNACWKELPDFFPGLELDAFQIMPDHVHCILVLTAQLVDGSYVNPPYNLPKVIAALKGNSARKINADLGSQGRAIWQKSYMDRVVRSERELEKFRAYILNNPLSALIKT